jgi:hypothetical protein
VLQIDTATQLICDTAVNPMLPFSFIYSFLETLESYFGEVTEHTIRENFDTVYMVSENEGIYSTAAG